MQELIAAFTGRTLTASAITHFSHTHHMVFRFHFSRADGICRLRVCMEGLKSLPLSPHITLDRLVFHEPQHISNHPHVRYSTAQNRHCTQIHRHHLLDKYISACLVYKICRLLLVFDVHEPNVFYAFWRFRGLKGVLPEYDIDGLRGSDGLRYAILTPLL